MNQKSEIVLFVAWVQAFLAVLGSLYFSEVKDFIPCEMCWFQRILMYPLVLLYGIALIKKDIRYAEAGIYMSGIGFLVSLYHYGIQKVPALQHGGESCGIVPCDGAYINEFGFVTIPFLAGIAFIVIFTCHLWLKRKGKM